MMPTDTLSDLRDAALARASWRCEWPGCGAADNLQLAHLEHRGRGGGEERNTLDNVAILCALHHDILDGRTRAGRRFEVSVLLAAWLGLNDAAHGSTEPRRRQ